MPDRWFPLLATLVSTVGCGLPFGEEPELETDPQNEGTGADTAATTRSSLSQDLVPATAPDSGLLQTPGDGPSGAPRVFYLHYADGRALPRTNPDPCRGPAPKFVCTFAPTLVECQRQIQTYLDRWYADFNIVFTLVRPTSGAFYTEVVSSGGGAWCDAAANVAGVAPFLCGDLQGGVAYTFRGGMSAKETAIIIAQEQAHLVGLEHTLSTKDIMDPTICPDCDGFEDTDNRIKDDRCGRSMQNSYEMLKARLGTWAGGIKPTPFGCLADSVAPLVQILSPSENSTVADRFILRVQASDDCKISRVAVDVAPMGLKAESTVAPFEWTLSKISGRQTITVTAVDPSGKSASASVTINAPGSPSQGEGGTAGSNAPGGPETGADAGCDVGGCDVGARRLGGGTQPVPWLGGAMLGLITASLLMRRRSRARRRQPARAAAGPLRECPIGHARHILRGLRSR